MLHFSRSLGLKAARKQLAPINDYYESYQLLTDEQLRAINRELMDQAIEADYTLDMRHRAFALVKEAARRVLHMVMYDVQLIGGWLMSESRVAEMATGEGKSLVSLLPAYWFGLDGQGVHVITVNEYLAKRDYEQMGGVIRFLGLTVGLNVAGMNNADKQHAYRQHVTYGVCSEFGFDYLRDRLATDCSQRVQRPLMNAIVDEIDSLLIDEARTPLIIAGKKKAPPDHYHVCARFVERFEENRDYEVDRESGQVMFTEAGVRRIEAGFMLDNLYDLDNGSIHHNLLQSLRAKVLMKRDVHYIVDGQQIKLIDDFTGRIMEGRQYSDGLHQAIEAKENLPLSEENRVHATITIQKYINMYEYLTGMSGTAMAVEEEMRQIYGLDTVRVPTNRPVIRHDVEDAIFFTKEEKFAAILEAIECCHRSGRPVLIGTTSVLQSEQIARRLDELGLTYRLLNAKTEQEEAEIVAMAGQFGAVTVATNMAGRGTDIQLGAGVAELGGLHVIGTERHESRRIDDQLRGRAGRQGDAGASRFYISLEDELISRYASDEAQELVESMKGKLRQEETRRFFTQVQERVEHQMFGIRALVCRLDAVAHEQRQAFYAQRDRALAENGIEEVLVGHNEAFIVRMLDLYCPAGAIAEDWELEKLRKALQLPVRWNFKDGFGDRREFAASVIGEWRESWASVPNASHEPWLRRWSQQVVGIMDRHWLDHLEVLETLKQGIHLQTYANRDIGQVYRIEAWKKYEQMERKIESAVYRELLAELAAGKQLQQAVLVRTG